MKALRILLAIATFLLAGHAVSHLIFGSLGQTPSDKAWNYAIALAISLGVGGAAAGVRSRLHPPFNRIATILAGAASGAVVGFYYAGVMTGKDPRWAIAGAVLGGLLLGGLGIESKSGWMEIVIRVAGAIAAYGCAFLIGATALTLLNVGYLPIGFLLSLVSLLYLWLTLNSILSSSR
ncbi:MAG: hypothetical protein IGS48_01060 [Oscillatoriales cyanobacterium C42_A2020_001]|nr:hypothetical protein [Leptolyngbyaceae cyanobacterium C42_A2020_001]